MSKIKKCIMAFGAHQDDIELRCGGTIARYVDSGYKTIYVGVATGLCHDSLLTEEDIRKFPWWKESTSVKEDMKNGIYHTHAEILNNESVAAAKVLRAEPPIFLNFRANYMWDNGKWKRPDFKDIRLEEPGRKPMMLVAPALPYCIEQVANLIIKYKPEIVLTHSPDDLHEDHYLTSVLVYRALRQASGKERLAKLYVWEPGSLGPVNAFIPDVIIDIGDYIERKSKALSKYKAHAGIGGTKTFEKFARERGSYWGKKIGIKYAEAFSSIDYTKLEKFEHMPSYAGKLQEIVDVDILF